MCVPDVLPNHTYGPGTQIHSELPDHMLRPANTILPRDEGHNLAWQDGCIVSSCYDVKVLADQRAEGFEVIELNVAGEVLTSISEQILHPRSREIVEWAFNDEPVEVNIACDTAQQPLGVLEMFQDVAEDYDVHFLRESVQHDVGATDIDVNKVLLHVPASINRIVDGDVSVGERAALQLCDYRTSASTEFK